MFFFLLLGKETVVDLPCGDDNCDTTGVNSECFPIPIPPEDHRNKHRAGECIKVVRTQEVTNVECKYGKCNVVAMLPKFLQSGSNVIAIFVSLVHLLGYHLQNAAY